MTTDGLKYETKLIISHVENEFYLKYATKVVGTWDSPRHMNGTGTPYWLRKAYIGDLTEKQVTARLGAIARKW